MGRRGICVFLIVMLLHTALAAPLEAEPPFDTDCASAILIEPESGQIIFEKNADDERPVASIVKMMTILLALEAMDSGRVQPEDIVTVSENASGMGGSQVLLDTGEQQRLDTLVMCMIVASANDAAVAVGEHIYGSVKLCVDRMNERAVQLGMLNTHFVNCTGLPAEGQYTTARDVALLSAELFGHEKYFEYSGIWLDELQHPDGRVTQLTNTNRLIKLYDGCDGGKTGSTNEAGYCISATAVRDDMRLIAVVLGSSTGKIRFSTAQEILDHGFANYRKFPVAQEGAVLAERVPVAGGAQDEQVHMADGAADLIEGDKLAWGNNAAVVGELSHQRFRADNGLCGKVDLRLVVNNKLPFLDLLKHFAGKAGVGYDPAFLEEGMVIGPFLRVTHLMGLLT